MKLNDAITRYKALCATEGKAPLAVDSARSANGSEGMGDPCTGISGTPSLGWLIYGDAHAPAQALAFIAEEDVAQDTLLLAVHEDSRA